MRIVNTRIQNLRVVGQDVTYTVNMLAVAGGGGGGGANDNNAGGGGAGGLLYGESLPVLVGTAYSIVVGAGGAGGSTGANGVNGENTTALGCTA